MKTIRAVYENGVFRPVQPVELPQPCTVEFEPRLITDAENQTAARKAVYTVLEERYSSGEHDVAARHNEHQP